MPMTPRERVLTALAHEEPDRVPIVIGPSHSTGIQMPVYAISPVAARLVPAER